MKYKLIIFDLDGTVLDTLDDLCDSVNYALRLHSMPERTLDEVRRFVGNGIGKLIERSVPSGCSERETSSVLKDFTEYYRVHCNDKTHPYDGIEKLLENLAFSGIPCAVLSNKSDSAVKVLCDIHFKDKFSHVQGEIAGLGKKPCPDGFLVIFDRFGVKKENVLYIGDSEVDVESAENVGIDMIAVDWGFRSAETLKATGAKRIAHSVSELEKMIME